jgi:acyl phosphate:glycerol-3-phosphate acyltransferase
VEFFRYAATAICAYLLGSIPSGYLMARARGVDIRKVGSGNIGATNVFRILGRPAGITVLLCDALKGFIAARYISFASDPAAAEYHAILAGLAAILGHNYTCWLRFKGGKGIATSAGVILSLAPLGLAVALGTWLVMLFLTKYVSVASIIAAMILPVGVWLTGGTRQMTLLTSVVGALAIYKHKGNMVRLMNGTENRFGKKKPKKEAAK